MNALMPKFDEAAHIACVTAQRLGSVPLVRQFLEEWVETHEYMDALPDSEHYDASRIALMRDMLWLVYALSAAEPGFVEIQDIRLGGDSRLPQMVEKLPSAARFMPFIHAVSPDEL